MKKPSYHLFVCNSFRINGEPKGTCNRKGGGLLQYLEEEILDRGIDALITSTGCMKECEKGPLLIVHSEIPKVSGWYGKVDEGAIDIILDALENDEAAPEYLISG